MSNPFLQAITARTLRDNKQIVVRQRKDVGEPPPSKCCNVWIESGLKGRNQDTRFTGSSAPILGVALRERPVRMESRRRATTRTLQGYPHTNEHINSNGHIVEMMLHHTQRERSSVVTLCWTQFKCYAHVQT